GSWEQEGRRFDEVATVARDGWTYVELVAWMPAREGQSARELGLLPGHLSLSGALAARLQDAVAAAAREVPYLSAGAAEMVMSQSAALALDPEVAFRRAYRYASSATTSLTSAEFKELAQLTNIVYGGLSPPQRERLAAYFDRVRANAPTAPEEDRGMM